MHIEVKNLSMSFEYEPCFVLDLHFKRWLHNHDNRKMSLQYCLIITCTIISKGKVLNSIITA